MKFVDAREELLEVIKNANTRFLSSYQICWEIEKSFPALWQSIHSEYGTAIGCPEMGAGAGQNYSPASFVSQALEYFSKTEKGICKQYLSCEVISFGDIEPGYTGNVVAIWAWQE